MTYRYVTNEIGLTSILFTTHSRVFGEVRANYYSLVEVLTASDQTYVVVTNAGVRPLTPEVSEELQSALVLLRKEHIIIGVPMDPNDLKISLAALTNEPGRYAQRAVVKAGPLNLDGVFSVARGAKLLDLLLHHPSIYLPMNDVTVSHERDAFPRFASPYVVLNPQWVDAVLDDPQSIVLDTPELLSAMDSPPAALEPDTADEPSLVHEVVDEAGAAEILLATDVFRDAEFGAVNRLMTELVGNDGITRQSIAAGGTVIRQGEQGDSLYLVEAGTLEVLINEPFQSAPRSVAVLGPGAIFGEMALLGDGRRTATVRAISATTLLVLSAQSWRVLAAQFPKATTSLLRIMTMRRGPKGGLLGRLR